jgi:hypothetical protein
MATFIAELGGPDGADIPGGPAADDNEIEVLVSHGYSTIIAGYCAGVELDDSGGRAVVTAGSVARLYDTSTMTELHSLSVSGTGGYHRISRDGTAIAAGGFNIRAAREVGGSWQNVYSGTGSQDWFGWGVALSGDGETLFVLSHNYGDGYLTNGHRLIDLTTGTEIGRTSYTGSGGLQNSAVGARANQDGTLFVAASWGDEFPMPSITIDGRTASLRARNHPPGRPRQHGIEIPHYCYHPGLSIVASCRICLAEVSPAQPAQRQQARADPQARAHLPDPRRPTGPRSTSLAPRASPTRRR